MPGLWVYPDNLENQYLYDYELGGIGLYDTSAGLRYQAWVLQLLGDDVVISADNWPQTVLFTRTGITELSLAFDQNMHPFVAFVENDVAKFWWYDTELPGTTFSNLPAGSTTPRCALDDKRETQTNSSDIILAYMKDNNVYTREQRDRFAVERLFQANVEGRIIRLGLSTVNRLQFLIQGPLPEGYIG